MRYRNNSPIVLKGLSLTIRSQGVVGIVGRTGSGERSVLGTSILKFGPWVMNLFGDTCSLGYVLGSHFVLEQNLWITDFH